MCSKILGERIFFDIILSLTTTSGGKKHQLLVMEDSTDYAWSYFLKEKSDVKNATMGLIKI